MDLGVRGSVKGKRIVENTEHRKIRRKYWSEKG